MCFTCQPRQICVGWVAAFPIDLRLDAVWPCRRQRAWWLLVSPDLGPIEMHPWKPLPNITQVQNVIPTTVLWSIDDETELNLDGVELDAFEVNTDKHGRNMLNAKGVAQCALHAWGSQLRPCPCGCRLYPLSKARLESKGLHGCLVRSAVHPDGSTHIRHVHPNEAMCLNSMDPVLDFQSSPRLVLSAVGQIAAPLQTLWVFGFLVARFTFLLSGCSPFDSDSQIQAYRSWLLMRCRMVWGWDGEIQDPKLHALVGFWETVKDLSLEEFLFPPRWNAQIGFPISIAAILDHLIRLKQTEIPLTVSDSDDVEPTPWYDEPTVVDVQTAKSCADSCIVFFEGSHDSPIRFQPKCTTVGEFLTAQQKLVGQLRVASVTLNGCCVSHDHVMEVGQVLCVTLTSDDDAPTEHEHVKPGEITPTLKWQVDPIEDLPIASPPKKSNKFDVGICTIPEPSQVSENQWLDAGPLLGLVGKQYLCLQTPAINTPQQLWSVRHQFLRVNDRLAVLNQQEDLWADDEIRIHLHNIMVIAQDACHKKGTPAPKLLMLDPLLATTWVLEKGFDCECWAKEHPEICQESVSVLTAVLLDQHWIPVFMAPTNGTLHWHTWDGIGARHDSLDVLAQRLSRALGFQSHLTCREHRMFFNTQLCGALAIAFLRLMILGSHLPSNAEEARYVHDQLKLQFTQVISSCQVTRRPWIWGAGESSDVAPAFDLQAISLITDQRIDLINERGRAMADDEIRFHIMELVAHQPPRATARGSFVFFEPLVFTCWDSIGHVIAEKWAEQHPQVFDQGQHVVTAASIDNHWLPIWLVPQGVSLQIHTFHDEFEGKARCERILHALALRLGFSDTTIHRIPKAVQDDSRCGAYAMAFIAHVVMRMPLPDSLEELKTLHTNMRASFVAHLYSVSTTPKPGVWGNGPKRECGPLPKMPVATADPASSEMPGNPSDARQRECGPLPRMPVSQDGSSPAERPVIHGDVPQREGGPLPQMPETSEGSRPSDMSTLCSGDTRGECGPLPRMPVVSEGLSPSAESMNRNEATPAVCGSASCCFSSPAMPDLPSWPVLSMLCTCPATVPASDEWRTKRQLRLESIAPRGHAMADDEILFHLEHILEYYRRIPSSSQQVVRQFVHIPPLTVAHWLAGNNFELTKWKNEVGYGQHLSHIIFAACIDQHWVPFWIAPQDDTLHCHTYHHPRVDTSQVDASLRGLAQELEFQGCVIHRVPNPVHDSGLCGPMAMSFLAHVILRTPLPQDDHQLRDRSWKMKQKFADAIHSRPPTDPIIWGWAGSGESRLLPTLPGDCPFVAEVQFYVHDLQFPLSLPTVSQPREGLAMGSDEMHFHLTQLALHCPFPVEVRVFHRGIEEVLEMVTNQHLHQNMLCAAVHMYNHWFPLTLVSHAQQTVAVVEYSWLSACLQSYSSAIVFVTQPPVHNWCGAHTILSLAVSMGFQPTSFCVQTIHQRLREVFDCMGSEPSCWGFGPSGQLLKRLVDELLQHGIPPGVVETRANDAIKTLGSEQVATALGHRQPWRQLKILGNQAKFHFVLPTELDAAIAANKGKPVGGKGKGKSKSKSKGKAPFTDAVDLDPHKLQVLEGIFKAQGKPVTQISVRQLGPVSSGVVLMSMQEAEPYLKSGQRVSQEPLAIAVLRKPGMNLNTALPQTEVTIPCRCTLDQEPVLVDAVLVQIGNGLIEKTQGTSVVQIDSLDVVTLKLMVYRDELQGDWNEFCQAPIRCLVSLLPMLKKCTQNPCDCAGWHNSEQLDIRDPILDVWRRQYLRGSFKPSPPDTAEVFSVCLRIPRCLLEALLAASGNVGIYCEPRTADGKEILPDFTVIWTPKHTLQEAQHLMRTNPAVTGLARLGERRGVRVHVTQAKTIHQLVRPDAVFLPQGPRCFYTVGPIPYGVDRHAVGRLLSKAGWECRPLQPTTPCPGRGAMWIVQAIDEPCQTIIHTTHGEIVISKQRQETSSPAARQVTVGSASTIALCGAQATSKPADADPWNKGDPWGGYKPTGPPSHPTAPTEGILQMEERIQTAVLAKMQTPMEQDDLPDRVHSLEGQVQLLLAKHQGLEGQMQEFNGHHSQQLASLQTQVNAQAQQIHGHLENQNQTIQSLFEQQMTQIRTLLAKRPRDENEWRFGLGPPACIWMICVWALLFLLGARGLYQILICVLGVAVCRFQILHDKMFCRWLQLFWVLQVFRIGEATNPGPQPAAEDFVLGAFNPSGLNGKAPYIVSHLAYGDVWAVSETHLCHKTLQKFRSNMHFAEGPYRYCVGGHPVPASNSSTFHQAWRGVAVLSKHPTRSVPTSWPMGIYESSRALVTATLVQDLWLTGATVYGEPESASYPNCKANNEALLRHAVDQVCHLSQGPRFVAGDWNVSPNTLPVFDALEAAGFRDLQDIAASQWGQKISPTCKTVTRKDYCFVSRELQFLLKEVQVADDVFPDHAVLWGKFHSLSQVLPRHVWFTPRPFPWPQTWDVSPHVWSRTQGSCDERYAVLWHELEIKAAAALPFALPKTVFGRATTYHTTAVRDGTIPPLKRARQGEVQPHFVAATYRHAQWLRQVRRLQAYVRYVNNHDVGTDHARAVWGSIVRSTGFRPSFVTWWAESQWKTMGAPASLPLVPPPAPVAAMIFDTLMLAFRAFESELQRASRQYARQRREQNPNLIFQDIRDFANKGVEVLVCAETAAISEVRAEEAAVVLDRPVQFDPDLPVVCNGQKLEVIHQETDCLWTSQTDELTPGMCVSQARHKGTTEELFTVFLQAWKQMWGRHCDVPPERWKTIMDFAHAFLPKLHLHWDALDALQLERCIASKKKTTTGGLDGVTIDDLRCMCPSALSNFVDMFHHAEATGEWPVQVLAGRVTCLAKVENPQDALDFRPITVLGILFRCWGTHNAKLAIRKLDAHLPDGLFGSRPTKYAGQVWSHLLWSIELAYENNLPLSGIMADIRKAFNYLPRNVILEACAIMGIPFRVLRAWAGALATLPRRFQFHGSTSPAAGSTCGLPEGCALSCLGMIVIDTLFHKWMLHFFPLCQPLSYVDDWQIIVADPTGIQGTFAALERFVQAIDLFLDARKTHTWSLQPVGRALMRQQGFATVAYGKNLGAHIQYSKQHTNKALAERMNSVQSAWSKLRLSASRYAHKVRAVLCSAWPRAMHGVAAATVSLASFQQLRAGAMKGFREDCVGANANVHLGLVERAVLDPHCWAILQTFRLTRDCGAPERVEPLLADLAMGRVDLPANTITQTLLQRIQALGWHINSLGCLTDLFGSFSLFAVSMTELVWRVTFQWTFRVAQEVSHRPCFDGLEACDPDATRDWLSGLETSDQALCRKLLNGTHITQDGKKFAQQADDDVCPYCECSDSRYHRFWECGKFEHVRTHISAEDRAVIRDLPPALTCCGWTLHPTTVFEWNEYFCTLPEPVLQPVVAQGSLHFFTDGSCFHQHLPAQRFAAWAIVQAADDDVDPTNGAKVVAAAPLPGLLQSAVRAEIYAVYQVLRITADSLGMVYIWTDSEAVSKKFKRIQAGHEVLTNSSHADLWSAIASLLRTCRRPCQITHVAAHQPVHCAVDVLQEWCFAHNALVDKAAVLANQQRPSAFWELHERHCQALAAMTHYATVVHDVQLRISQEVVRGEKPVQLEPVPEELADPDLRLHWTQLPPLQLPQAALRWYGDSVVRSIVSWFWQGVHEAEGPPLWLSHFQLYADYMMATGLPGPIRLRPNDCWRDGSDLPHLDLLGFGFKQRTKWFVKVWKEILRH